MIATEDLCDRKTGKHPVPPLKNIAVPGSFLPSSASRCFNRFFFSPSFMFRPWSNQSRCRGWKTWNEFVKNASSRASLSKRESIYGIFGVLGRGGGHYSRAGTKIKEGNTRKETARACPDKKREGQGSNLLSLASSYIIKRISISR